MKLILFSLLFLSSASFAQVDLMQSSPSIKWKSIENPSVKVIYPDYLGAESTYIANLVEHYSHVVGQTLGRSAPEKFDLIIRTEVAAPNGYVTLSPRRSEWFASSMFFPSIGSTEWYQTLAIHEYRHVNQFDHAAKATGTSVLHTIMGDFGEQLAVFMALPSWYMEGDAVWAETKYTDGGRGRSPRFLARLKAILLTQPIPTYDQFLSGTYKTALPNQYVYGYALISYGTQKYGERVWTKVAWDAATFPHPFRFYSSFEKVTGQNFEGFYNEAMNDLKTKWAADGLSGEVVDYRENYAPEKIGDALYSLHRTLDSYVTVRKEQNGQITNIGEINFSKDFMQIQFGKSKAVLTEFAPDNRYGHKGFSTLVLMDLKNGSLKRIVKGRRIYNPSFNLAENKILAIEFLEDQSWKVVEFDLNGKQLQSFSLAEGKIAEIRYLTDKSAVAVLSDKTGLRSLVEIDLQDKKLVKTYLPGSRNIITSLFVDKSQRVVFKAQSQGKNEIFMLNEGKISQCSASKIGAYTPSSDGDKIYYSDMDGSGSVIASQAISSCKEFDAAQLVDYRYLGENPSDNYNGFPPAPFPDQENMFTKNSDQYKAEDYGDFDRRLLVPHTWGLMLGRGGGLGFATDNYLRTLGTTFLLGVSPEEGGNFTNFSFDIKKYYPIFNLQAEVRRRKTIDFATEDKLDWQEKNVMGSVLIPYIKGVGLYNFSALLQGEYQHADTSDYKFNDFQVAGSEKYDKTSSGLLLSWSKNPKPRSIQSPWLVSYRAQYDDAREASYRLFQEAIAQTPGAFQNDGFKFSFAEQKQPENPGYRFLPVGATFDTYAFSRGYDYKAAPLYQKISGNYVFPISYENFALPRWYYLKRTYGTLFFDSTYVTSPKVEATLNSYGLEARFESTFFRVLPITFGGRVLQRLLDNEVRTEFFLATAVF
jgi:hypothetical protein